MAGALVPFPHIAGVASSTLMFVQMALSSGYNVVYSMVFEPGVTSLAAGMFGPITLGFFVAWFVGAEAQVAVAVVDVRDALLAYVPQQLDAPFNRDRHVGQPMKCVGGRAAQLQRHARGRGIADARYMPGAQGVG